MSHPLRGVKDAADAVRLYFHFQAGAGQVRAIALPERKEVCRHCSKGPPVGRTGRRRNCGNCGRRWIGAVVGDHVQGPRDTGAAERSMDLQRRICAIVEPRGRHHTETEWIFDLQAFALCIEGNGRSDAAVAELGAQAFEHLEAQTRPWTELQVKESRQAVDKVIGTRLARAKRRRARG